MEAGKQFTHQIRMFGSFEARRVDAPNPRAAWGRQKSLSIAKYLLAHRGEVVSIEQLAELFYDGAPVERIRSNVRGRISEIRQALWPGQSQSDAKGGFLAATPSGYRLDADAPLWIDVEWFKRYRKSANEYYEQEMWQIALEDFNRAHSLYRGDFLADDLDEPWADDLRERLRIEYQSSLTCAAECLLHLGHYRQAAATARRAQDIDSLDEDAYRLQIQALGLLQDKAGALSVYKELVCALEEIGVEPDPEIDELVQRIERGQLRPHAPKPKHNLRQPATTFIGREHELAILTEELAGSDTRVVTLLGAGGIGKTRLATEAGRELASVFRDGVFFVPVGEYAGDKGLAAGIAQAVGFSPGRPERGFDELADYLSNKQMLMVIDSAEHLGDVAPLADILLRAPGVKLLVTSRTRLHLPGELIIDVQGLPFPPDPSAAPTTERTARQAPAEATPAFRLFVDRYARLRPRFRPDDDDRRAIARICRLVGGMPLAIEMAASWGRVLTCGEIADRLANSVGLADTLDDPREGMRDVFTFSWMMLTDAEKQAALRLSTFAGSFSRTAAESVAQCPPSLIMSLTDKSLVQMEHSGRFRVHEVIRSYLRRELSARPADEEEAREAHAAYFASLLARAAEPHGDGLRRVDALRHDLPDVQEAWRWWVSRFDVDALRRALPAVCLLHERLAQWAAAAELLESAIARTLTELAAPGAPEGADTSKKATVLLCATLYTFLGHFKLRMSDLQSAGTAIEEGRKLLQTLRSAHEASTEVDRITAIHNRLAGRLALDRGDWATATERLTAAEEALRALGETWQRARALSQLATVARLTGDLERALKLYEESLSIHQQLGDTQELAGELLNLGAVYGNLHKYDEAQRYFEEARRYAEQGGHRLLLFYALGNSGFLSYRRSRLDEAEGLCREALDIAMDLGSKAGEANVAYYLALIALDRREAGKALPYLRQALEKSLAAQMMQLVLQVLHGYARYLVLRDESEAAAALLYFVANHPSYPDAARRRSQEVLAELAPRLTPERLDSAAAKAAEQSLDQFVAGVRALSGSAG